MSLKPEGSAGYGSRPLPPAPARSRPWYLWLDHIARPGFLNMSIDSALLALAEIDGVGFLRLYRWDPPCVSFGRHEPATRRYDRMRVRALGVDAVRRPTGGRAVWHKDELTYAVAAPLGALGTLRASCERVHAMLRDALALLGVDATLAPAPVRTAAPGAGSCFATAAGGELLVGGRKVAGSAQLRTDRALLQHGSLLLGGDQRRLAELTAAPPPHVGRAVPAPPLGRPVRFAEAAAAVAQAARRWEGAWRDIDRGEPILELAAAYADGFRSDAWTWCR
ncbi:MAG: lipoate--protein ligase family protein [Gemmatimonadales bacterium]